MYASSEGCQETVAVLLEYRAQVNLADQVRGTKLWYVHTS